MPSRNARAPPSALIYDTGMLMNLLLNCFWRFGKRKETEAGLTTYNLCTYIGGFAITRHRATDIGHPREATH